MTPSDVLQDYHDRLENIAAVKGQQAADTVRFMIDGFRLNDVVTSGLKIIVKDKADVKTLMVISMMQTVFERSLCDMLKAYLTASGYKDEQDAELIKELIDLAHDLNTSTSSHMRSALS